MICQTCLGAIQRLEHVYYKDPRGALSLLHHRSAAKLKAAAESRCRFCCTFWDQLTSSAKEQLLSSDRNLAGIDQPIQVPDPKDRSEEALKSRLSCFGRYTTYCTIRATKSSTTKDDFRTPTRIYFHIDIGTHLDTIGVHSDRGKATSMFVLQLDVKRSAKKETSFLHPARRIPTGLIQQVSWRVTRQKLSLCLETLFQSRLASDRAISNRST